MFSRFFKKKKAPSSGELTFPFAESAQELPGTEATNRKRLLDARAQFLENLAEQVRPLSPDEQAELVAIKAEIASLLDVEAPLAGVGQLPAHEVPDSEYNDWVSQAPLQAKILLIEDDPDIHALLDYMLQQNRFEPIRFNDGKLARDWIVNHSPPDLVSLDIMLPHFDGLQLIAIIRSQPGWERVPIIVLSSKSDEPTVQRALQLGANEYLAKPFHPEEYLTRIKHLLAAH